VAADFLLHGVEADEGEGGLLFRFRDALHDLGDDVAADAVVERAAGEAFVGELDRAVLIDRRVSDADAERGDLLRVRRADVDPQVVDGGLFRGQLRRGAGGSRCCR
jgi:hypothetical protein